MPFLIRFFQGTPLMLLSNDQTERFGTSFPETNGRAKNIPVATPLIKVKVKIDLLGFYLQDSEQLL
jgi:hypothetical protein